MVVPTLKYRSCGTVDERVHGRLYPDNWGMPGRDFEKVKSDDPAMYKTIVARVDKAAIERYWEIYKDW